MKIFVGNVDGADTTPEELAALFAPYGTVMSCAVMKQFAFVHMRENAGALRAIEALHGHELRPGRALVVEMSRPRPLNTWKISWAMSRLLARARNCAASSSAADASSSVTW